MGVTRDGPTVPHDVYGAPYLRHREHAENFPVAMRMLPRPVREHLRAVYDVARTIDDLGDDATGDRVALLESFSDDLAALWHGREPRTAVLRRLRPTVERCRLDREPFDRLIAANLQDQRISTYRTYGELLSYCQLSAQPVGRIVLAVFGAAAPELMELSDRVCTALQLIEHWQDVGEDRRRGRVYLPDEDLRSYGVDPVDLDAAATGPALRRLMEFETRRAEALLDSGAPLVGRLHGWARPAVAGYVAGGRAAIGALRRERYEVLAASPRPRRRAVARHAVLLLATNGRLATGRGARKGDPA